jgi:hypothetical protein
MHCHSERSEESLELSQSLRIATKGFGAILVFWCFGGEKNEEFKTTYIRGLNLISGTYKREMHPKLHTKIVNKAIFDYLTL